MSVTINLRKLTLDIGCGNDPKGDVNCDFFVGFTPHIMKENKINPSKIPNFVRCSAEFLPFKENAFNIVNASEVLEHILRPSYLLNEMNRVSSNIVTLDVPNLRRLTPDENPNHIYTWSPVSLKNLLSLFFIDIVIVSSGYGSYLQGFLSRKGSLRVLMFYVQSVIEKLLGPPFIKAICKVDKNLSEHKTS